VQLLIVELKIQNSSGHFGGCGEAAPGMRDAVLCR
jgi:hypothetical protein